MVSRTPREMTRGGLAPPHPRTGSPSREGPRVGLGGEGFLREGHPLSMSYRNSGLYSSTFSGVTTSVPVSMSIGRMPYSISWYIIITG